ncbi:MAG: hypothetical protein ACRBCI_07990 [Cellvibrionaceae bacterium]
MSQKKLIIMGALLLLIVNGSIFGTIYVVDMLAGPSKEELLALREAEQRAALDSVYAKLPPLEEFKSKARYVHSMGQAIGLCENKLHQEVTERKSWEVNMIESRYLAHVEEYKIFIKYETAATQEKPQKKVEVECVVSGEKRSVEAWNIEK